MLVLGGDMLILDGKTALCTNLGGIMAIPTDEPLLLPVVALSLYHVRALATYNTVRMEYILFQDDMVALNL